MEPRKHVLVIGGGTMGQGIAPACALAGQGTMTGRRAGEGSHPHTAASHERSGS